MTSPNRPNPTPPPGLRIRPFTPADYDAAVALSNAVFPEYPETASEWRYQDDHRDPKLHFARFLAEGPDGRPVGLGACGHRPYHYHPHKLWVDVRVLPGARRRGVGGALYAHMLEHLAAHAPTRLWADAREDHPHGVAFLEQRGFGEVMREWENHLRTADFDPAAYRDRVAAVEASGIELCSLAELEAAGAPDHERKLYEAAHAIGRDVPQTETPTDADFDTWIARVRTHPGRLTECFVVAVDGDRYVGLTNIWKGQANPRIGETGLTGVRPAYRRRGLATALKARSLEAAKAHGLALVKTWNATTNTGMLAINEALGFVRQPAWIAFEKDIER